jgi:Zn-dependent M28 family amino/carboxypeptidase
MNSHIRRWAGIGFRGLLLGTAAVVVLFLFGAWFMTVQPVVTASRRAAPSVDPARLEAHVRALSEVHHPRSVDVPERLAAGANYVREALRQAGAMPISQAFDYEGKRFENIVARFGPKTGPLLVIGAHYDSHGAVERGAYVHTPGADDNASGVAALIELARLLTLNPPARPVELVAYTLEEPPVFRTAYMGSAVHASSLRAAGRDVELMISLEMVGYFSAAEATQSYPLPGMRFIYPDRGDFIAVVSRWGDWAETRRAKRLMAASTDLPVWSINAPKWVPGIDFSDHLNYWEMGIPAVMVTDTAFYRNHEYHRSGDTWDRLDYPRMAKVVQAVYSLTTAD